jgi:GTP-binding protein
MTQKVAIVGRPNVGKSSLFNRLIGKRKSIVDPQSGVTRDRIYEIVEWDRYSFELIDTGGLDFAKNCSISQRISEQVKYAINEAQVILFLVDGKDGINPYDKEVSRFLLEFSKPVVLAVNKIDTVEEMTLATEFYQIGFDRIYPVSALHGLGLDDLLEETVSYLTPVSDTGEQEEDIPKITIVGKPNVGKSTLLNVLLEEDRAMVDDVPGTTRDIIDTRLVINNVPYLLVDTAGIRHKKKFDNTIESYAFFRTEDAIKRSDLIFMIIDAQSKVTRQDERIISMIIEAGKAVVLIINKWDLFKNVSKSDYLKEIERKISFVSYVPVVFISAKEKINIPQLFKIVPRVLENYSRRISTQLLNKMISDAIEVNPPPLQKGNRLKVYYAVQTKIKPPTFTLFANNKKYFSENYKRYLVNILRKLFEFEGSPVIMFAKSKQKR